MQIVKLADACEAGFQHLRHKAWPRLLSDVVRRHGQGETYITPAPRPKIRPPSASRCFGVAGHTALESVAVEIGQARNDQSAEFVARLLRDADLDRADFARFDGEAHIAAPALRRQRCLFACTACIAASPSSDYVIYIIAAGDKPGRAEWRRERADRRVWRNARLATLAVGASGLGIVERGALAAENGRIVYAGSESEAPRAMLDGAEIIDCEGRWITPGLIDCHTHLVFAGDRAQEFELRLAGASYEEIARASGGIVSSVKALRATSEEDLVRATTPRLDALISEGATTIEIKSGYGLDLSNEAKSLRVARRLPDARDVTIRTTFLGAHALPPEMDGDKKRYIDAVVGEMIPAIARDGLADAVDGFCEGIAFSPDEIARVFAAAKAHELPVKLHADQLSNLHGAALADGASARSPPTISNIPTKTALPPWRRQERSPSCYPAQVLFHPRDAAPADRGFSPARRQDGRRHGLQSRYLAADLAVAGGEHGGDPVSDDD